MQARPRTSIYIHGTRGVPWNSGGLHLLSREQKQRHSGGPFGGTPPVFEPQNDAQKLGGSLRGDPPNDLAQSEQGHSGGPPEGTPRVTLFLGSGKLRGSPPIIPCSDRARDNRGGGTPGHRRPLGLWRAIKLIQFDSPFIRPVINSKPRSR